MRKTIYYTSAMAVCAIIMAGFAEARHGYQMQHKAYDESQKLETEVSKEMRDVDDWREEKNEKIAKKYEKAIKCVDDSKLEDSYKELLRKQALENKQLAEKHLKEKADLLQKHHDERDGAMGNTPIERNTKKAIKKIKEIL